MLQMGPRPLELPHTARYAVTPLLRTPSIANNAFRLIKTPTTVATPMTPDRPTACGFKPPPTK